jgi:hypothetical protein
LVSFLSAKALRQSQAKPTFFGLLVLWLSKNSQTTTRPKKLAKQDNSIHCSKIGLKYVFLQNQLGK